jgi:hypothetical protein
MSTQFSSVFAAAAKPADSTLAEAAHNELRIKEESAALIRSARDMATLIRDLQELWLSGHLDTLAEPVDEQETKEKALRVAEQIEALVGKVKSEAGGS